MIALLLSLQIGSVDLITATIRSAPGCAQRNSGDLIADMHCTPLLSYNLDVFESANEPNPSLVERAYEMITKDISPTL